MIEENNEHDFELEFEEKQFRIGLYKFSKDDQMYHLYDRSEQKYNDENIVSFNYTFKDSIKEKSYTFAVLDN